MKDITSIELNSVMWYYGCSKKQAIYYIRNTISHETLCEIVNCFKEQSRKSFLYD